MHKTSWMAQKPPWRWRKDLSAGERGWVSAGRAPSPRGDCCWWWVLLETQTSNPPWVTSWLLPAQATPGTPFSQQLVSHQGRGGGTLYFLGCRCARDWWSKPSRCCQKIWCYSGACLAMFCAPGELFRIKITHNWGYLTSLGITLYLWRLKLWQVLTTCAEICYAGGCLRLTCSQKLLSKKVFLTKRNNILFHLR